MPRRHEERGPDRNEDPRYDEEYGRRGRAEDDWRLDREARDPYRRTGRREETGYGTEWPERYGSDVERGAPERLRDSWSERQSGPYRSSVSGRPLSEDEYRQEARYYRSPYRAQENEPDARDEPGRRRRFHYHRSAPFTGFSGRVSEFGYEDPGWAEPQMGRRGAPTGACYAPPGAGFRGHGPRNYSRSDERIKEDICDGLADDEECDAREIDIEVKDAKVTMTGSVPFRYMKHRAEDIADETRGVNEVDNRVRVDRRLSEESGERYTGSGERYTVGADGGFVRPTNKLGSEKPEDDRED